MNSADTIEEDLRRLYKMTQNSRYGSYGGNEFVVPYDTAVQQINNHLGAKGLPSFEQILSEWKEAHPEYLL